VGDAHESDQADVDLANRDTVHLDGGSRHALDYRPHDRITCSRASLGIERFPGRIVRR
jgi:hypothetical protein